ncbi:MAG: D-tyrosyl-tRNA(Tyr) deacylase [Gammaproteobacteria bacterium]|nr:D-tyrosyl-tRNA(Tyr) deacylase [Gammaproteobacteria bacterium]
MRALIERVKYAKCEIDGKVHSSIDKGLLVYIAFTLGDDSKTITSMVQKIKKLRIFEDENHKMNKSILDIGGEVLLISSFSLYGDTKGNNRPSFVKSLNYHEAEPLFNSFISELEREVPLKVGVFGADMMINAVNDGPVSIIIDM